MESVDLRASLGRERQVKMRRLFAGLEDDQRSVVVRTAKLDTVRRLALRDDGHPERFERAEEKRLARREIADSGTPP